MKSINYKLKSHFFFFKKKVGLLYVIIQLLQYYNNTWQIKIKDGCWWPYLSMDRNHFRTDTTRPLGDISDKFLKNPTSGLGGDAIPRKSLRMYGRMDARWSTVRKALPIDTATAKDQIRSAWASTQSDQSSLSAWRMFRYLLPIKHTMKTLLRLGGCPGRSESSLDAHMILYFV